MNKKKKIQRLLLFGDNACTKSQKFQRQTNEFIKNYWMLSVSAVFLARGKAANVRKEQKEKKTTKRHRVAIHILFTN